MPGVSASPIPALRNSQGTAQKSGSRGSTTCEATVRGHHLYRTVEPIEESGRQFDGASWTSCRKTSHFHAGSNVPGGGPKSDHHVPPAGQPPIANSRQGFASPISKHFHSRSVRAASAGTLLMHADARMHAADVLIVHKACE